MHLLVFIGKQVGEISEGRINVTGGGAKPILGRGPTTTSVLKPCIITSIIVVKK